MTCQAYPGSGIITLSWMGYTALGKLVLFCPLLVAAGGGFFYFIVVGYFDGYCNIPQNTAKYFIVAQMHYKKIRFLRVKNLFTQNLVISTAIQMFLIVL